MSDKLEEYEVVSEMSQVYCREDNRLKGVKKKVFLDETAGKHLTNLGAVKKVVKKNGNADKDEHRAPAKGQ